MFDSRATKIAIGIGAGLLVLGASAAAIVGLVLLGDEEIEGEEQDTDELAGELDRMTQLGVPGRGEGFKL